MAPLAFEDTATAAREAQHALAAEGRYQTPRSLGQRVGELTVARHLQAELAHDRPRHGVVLGGPAQALA